MTKTLLAGITRTSKKYLTLLIQFFGHFGTVEALEIYGKVAVVLFRTFFDANTAKEFLQNGTNFKETEQNNFESRWFINEDEYLISPQMKQKTSKSRNKAIEQRMAFNGQQNNYQNYNNGYYGNNNSQYGYDHSSSNINSNTSNEYNGLYKSHSYNCENTAPIFNVNNVASNNNSKSNRNSYSNKFNPTSRRGSNGSNNPNVGKYTCRFEIQVDNDKDFQIARRLIGAKVKHYSNF